MEVRLIAEVPTGWYSQPRLVTLYDGMEPNGFNIDIASSDFPRLRLKVPDRPGWYQVYKPEKTRSPETKFLADGGMEARQIYALHHMEYDEL